MTPEQKTKRVKRALRTIPLDAIAPEIAARESSDGGFWCLIDGKPSFVTPDGTCWLTLWRDESLAYAQYHRWVAAHPERVHETYESALRFVRSQLGWSDGD